jgi:hypothetical protein
MVGKRCPEHSPLALARKEHSLNLLLRLHDYLLMVCRVFTLSLAFTLIGACAPVLDRGVADFNLEVFYADLNNFRGGRAVEAALETAAQGL